MLSSRTAYFCFFINSQSTFLINISRITERKRKTEVPHEVRESLPHNGIMPILTFQDVRVKVQFLHFPICKGK